MIERLRALKAWEDFIDKTRHLFQDVLLCGSVRRGQPLVKDLDFVARPCVLGDSQWLSGFTHEVPFFQWVMENVDEEAPEGYGPKFVFAPKHPLSTLADQVVVRFFIDGVQFDGYMSYTEKDFWPQVVIRTGPARPQGHYGPDDPGAMQNPALAVRAKRLGLRLQMGPGLLNSSGEYVGWESERAFFEALALPYCEPEYRDDPQWIGMIWSSHRWPAGSTYPEELTL